MLAFHKVLWTFVRSLYICLPRPLNLINTCSLLTPSPLLLPQDTIKKLGEFRGHLVPLYTWLGRTLPKVDEGEAVHGDVGTVAVLADIHAVSDRRVGQGGSEV